VDAGCNPDLRTFSYTQLALMLLDFTRVFDAKGSIERRGFGAADESDEYVIHFGVVRRQWPEFISSGLDEAPLCFSLTGESRTGRALTTNIVPLPKDALAKAAAAATLTTSDTR
jgi:hypothetical protein